MHKNAFKVNRKNVALVHWSWFRLEDRCTSVFVLLFSVGYQKEGFAVSNASVNSSCAHPPPPVGHLSALPVPGWRICKFCASRGPDICQPRGQPRGFDTYAVSSHASAKISPVGAFPCLPYAFPLLICISVFLHTNLGSSRILI